MTLVWAGLATGAVYALVGLSFTIVLAGSDVFNFAQPQFTMLGAFLGFWGLAQSSLPLVLVLAAAGVVGAALGWFEELVAIRPVHGRHGYPVLVTTVGFSVALNGVAVAVWGSTPQGVPVPSAGVTLDLLGGRVTVLDLTLIGLAVAIGLALQYAARRTRWGLAGRAVASDTDAAVARGVDARQLRVVAFVVAGAFACAVGVLIGGKLSANTDLGNSLVILGFVGLAVGGMGSHVGALLGGLFIGVVQVLASRFLGSEYELILLFGMLLAVLLLRPAGVLGGQRERVV